MSYKDKWKQKAVLEKLCINCGKELFKDCKIQLCDECNKIHIKKSIERVKKIRRKENSGLCWYCGKKSINKKCNKCKENFKKYKKQRYDNFKKNNVCCECGDILLKNQIVCKKHFLMSKSKQATGSTKKWKELEELLNKQNFKCFYSNEKIKLGVTASIDHIIPISKNGLKELQNLVWCHIDINIMKRGLEKNRFIKLCKEVYKNNNY